ncbi:response regulator transcription factor [Aliidiomarina sanyensis]|uniref:DNA-binding response regulator n=1 Tax=Aliidiomarina sanyensis TaxID=1249555 RepID=A0A432WNM1_9GAMM|nr:response regulator transcription factor [Aliidiomarina sanyensis]RUO35400.1 DNA-binding response regulator [Aliidiomarina sanyensis]
MNILLIEDDQRVADFIVRGLRAEGYRVHHCADGAAALEFVRELEPSLIILDRMLPNIDGMTLCNMIRSVQLPVKILMLSALNEVRDRVQGLNTGADDYLGKPFAFEELLARIETLLRRTQTHARSQQLKLQDIVFDLEKMQVLMDGRHITLTAKELAVLELLMHQPGKVFSRERILANVWGMNEDPLTNVVDVYIRRLRKKLNAKEPERYIRTLRGMGYFAADTPSEDHSSDVHLDVSQN